MLSLVIPTMLAGAALYSPGFIDVAGWSFPPSGEETTENEAAGIDVNEACANDLLRLPGIGPKKALSIVRERKRRPFRRPSDLLRVKGIGRKTLKRMAPMLRFKSR